ncbi:MAG: peptidoglycan DD-metalloendopeptidase family protein [Oscillospiraceae bacterium]|nr:peptidoglycan DD-metalloendopeptidase family protein [Oscillospiraceae bacterium]
MIKNYSKKITIAPLLVLQSLGEAAVAVIIFIIKNFFEIVRLLLKFLWDKTIKLRTKTLNLLKYGAVFVFSPVVKLFNDFMNMRREMRKQKRRKGVFWAVWEFLKYSGKFLFGKRGLTVTLFNYAAPVLSIVFLFNVVSFAASSNYALKLTVNGQFLGYVEDEQVFMDAEAIVLQRVNHYGSENTIEMIPDFSIERIGFAEMLTKYQIANLILTNSDFTLVNAYGFFIDGVFLGAITEDNIDVIHNTLENLLDVYRTGNPDAEISFMNNIEYDKYELYLAESIVDPRDIIRVITAKKQAAAYYTVVDGDSQWAISDKMGMSIEDIEKMNPGFSTQFLRPGEQIKRNVEEPYLPVAVTQTEEYIQTVPFEIEYRDVDSLYAGQTREVQAGVEGENYVVARASYVNGAEISRVIESTVVLSEPVTRIINRGTKQLTTGSVSTEHAAYGKFIWPTSGGYVSCAYGWDGSRLHRAIDIAGIGYGAPIYAAGSGTVTMARYNYSGYGHTVMIRHDNGLVTLYAHNSQLLVTEGQQVIQGEQIANAGSTGYSSGVHLHFEVRSGNELLNPMLYLS